MPSGLLVKRCGIAVLAMSVLVGCSTCLDVELRDAATLAPIEGARVKVSPVYVLRLDRPQPVEGVTDAQGRVAFPEVGATNAYRVEVDATGYLNQQVRYAPAQTKADEWTKLQSVAGAAEIDARITECDHCVSVGLFKGESIVHTVPVFIAEGVNLQTRGLVALAEQHGPHAVRHAGHPDQRIQVNVSLPDSGCSLIALEVCEAAHPREFSAQHVQIVETTTNRGVLAREPFKDRTFEIIWLELAGSHGVMPLPTHG